MVRVKDVEKFVHENILMTWCLKDFLIKNWVHNDFFIVCSLILTLEETAKYKDSVVPGVYLMNESLSYIKVFLQVVETY